MGRKPGDHFAAFCDHILNRNVQIRETRQHDGDGLPGSLWTDRQTRRERVIGVIGSVEVIEGRQIPLVEHFLVKTADQGLVVFG